MVEAIELVTVRPESTAPEFLLLTPGSFPARTGPYFNRIITYHDLAYVLTSALRSEYCAVDFETQGGDFSSDIRIVGIGLSWSQGSCYIPWTDLFEDRRRMVVDFLATHTGLIAHNVYFDGGVARKVLGFHPHWHVCTYALLAMLHNESPESRWGLKDAQVNLLGWTNSNEGELDEWLVGNGFYRGNRLKDNTPEHLINKYRDGALSPDKGEMWRAPKEVLGKYCCLDAESTYLLFTEVLLPVLNKFPGFERYFLEEWMTLIHILIDQKIHGIEVDRDALLARRQGLLTRIDEYGSSFVNHEQVRENVHKIEKILRAEVYENFPPQFKKDGTVSKNYLNKLEKIRRMEAGEFPEFNFNVNSGDQLRILLYDHLKFPVRMYTEKGQPAVGIKAFKHMGDIGKLLTERMWLVKELGFIDKYLELTESRSTIHPSFRAPGTVTGRLSSKEPNMQQIPKSKMMMSMFRARPGHVWVDLDFSALEPVVATEFSQDPNMMFIYGDGAPPNDIYLYVGAHIPGMSEKIRRTGYDPRHPTKETLAAAKKQAKHERSICKTVVLACQYGAGVNKVMQTLEADDVILDYEEVAKIHSGYWDLFAKVKDFSRSLFFEWRRNRGHIVNGLGRPMAVPEDYTKDLLNRFIQSTGHDILIKYVCILTRNLDAAGIPWSPIIIDFHDATTVEVPELDAERTVQVFNKSMDDLNRVLNGTIRLRGVPTVGVNLAEVKEPEE